jgi:nucleotide-binding universal stress UspA family protein
MSTSIDAPIPTASLYGRILCVTDDTAAGREAAWQASALACDGGRLEFVTVAPPAPQPQPWQIEALVQARSIASAFGVRAEAHIVDEVDVLARCTGRDLLVIRPGLMAAHPIAACPVSVLVARAAPDDSSFLDSVLVGIDGTPAAHGATRVGARIAATHGALIAIVATPAHDEPHRHALQSDVATVRQLTGSDTLVLDEHCAPVPAILRAAQTCGATLIVLGGRPGAPPDSVSAEVAALAACSVLVVRGGGGATANY